MKLTIWEKNNLYNLLGSIQDAPWKDLELVRDLRATFSMSDTDAWEKYSKLAVLPAEKLTDSQAAFLADYGKKIHTETEEIQITKREFQFIYDKISGRGVRLPAGDLIEYSISFKQKLEKKKEEADLL